MKRILITAMLSIAAAGTALAADLPQPAPPPPQAPAAYIPTVAPVYNWGGIYLGINGGWAFGNSDWTGAAVPSGNFDLSGGVGGGTLGFNFQTDAFVFGVETDFDYSGVSGNGPSSFCTNCFTSSSWIGTTRVRVGYAADRVLFYGTGGGAYGNVQAGGLGVFDSNTEFGWTAGAGVEAAFADNWTARIEYLFVDLSKGSFNVAGGTPTTQAVSFDESLVRAGVDFKFR